MIRDRIKNLVIGAVGDKSLHHHWLNGKRNYDLFLIYFGDGQGYEGEGEYYKRAKGYKFHLLQDLLNERPELFDYKYIWLPDDDLYATPEEINRIFWFMRKHRLELAQPSIMGHYGVDITLHQKGSLLRFTNWIEIMCPCFSSSALKTCMKTFKENETGWSIETIWNVLLGHPRDKIAIIDDIIVTHTRPVLTGDTHNKHADPLKRALDEANEVYYRYGLDREMEKDIKYGTPTGGEVYCTVVYSQIKKPMEDGIPRQDRCWPHVKPFTDWLKTIGAQPESSCKTANPDATASG
jgi:hypothetical protein